MTCTKTIILIAFLFYLGCSPALVGYEKKKENLIAIEGSLLYHREECPILNAIGYFPSRRVSYNFSTHEEAKKKGFLPCPRCIDQHWEREMPWEEGLPFLAIFLSIFLIPWDSWYFGFTTQGFSGYLIK
jgi:hypothetical protein